MSTTSLIYNPLLKKGLQYVTNETNYPEVATYADLPVASTVTGLIYYVDTGTGSLWTLNRKDPGLYRSNGSTWVSADIPSYFSSSEFKIQDNITPSKQLAFNISAISSSTTRTITVPNADVDLTNIYQTASGSNNGYLSSTDWTTFNNKQSAFISGTNLKTVNGTTLLGSGDLGIISPTYGGTGVNNGSFLLTVPETGTAALLGTANVFSANQSITLSTTGDLRFNVANANGGTGARTFINFGNGTANGAFITHGTAYATAGLLSANLTMLQTYGTGSPGILYASNNASTYHRWAIGGTAAGNQIMNLNTIGLSLTPTAQSSGTTAMASFTQPAHTGGAQPGLLWTAGALTSQTTATEVVDINYDLGAVLKSVDGTIPVQRSFVIKGRTYTPQTSALTITNSSVLDVTQSLAGSGTTITNNWTQRWLYDASNYMGVKMGSTGSATFQLIGTSPFFTFNNSIVMNGGNFQSNSGATTSNLFINNGGTIASSQTASQLLFAGATNINGRVWMRGNSTGTPAAGNSVGSFIIGTHDYTIAGSGAHALFAQMVIKPITITAGVGALTNSASLYIEDAATGATNNYSLWVAAGASRFDGNIKLSTAGNGLYIKEGTNATMGVATLVLGTVTVNTTKVTANSRIFLSVESLGTISSPVAIAITARSAGTSFTITSANLTDTSVISWIIIEPS